MFPSLSVFQSLLTSSLGSQSLDIGATGIEKLLVHEKESPEKGAAATKK